MYIIERVSSLVVILPLYTCTCSQDDEDKRYLWLPSMDDSIRPAICVIHAWRKTPTLPVTPAQLKRPGIGRNASCALGDCSTSRPEGCSQSRKLWFVDILMHCSVLY